MYIHLVRKKLIPPAEVVSKLEKSLGLIDLIFLGVGSTLGVGIYILSGSVAKDNAGPGITASFFIAAVISILAGICYAEFGARTSVSGSIYSYSYVTLGEFTAFVMGWNLITQYSIGAASVIKALSVYGDTFFNNAIQNYFKSIYEINVPFISHYFDGVAFGLSIFLAVILSYGLKESMILNTTLTLVNISMVLFFIILGLFYIDLRNWNLPSEDVPPLAGSGGFFPFGLEGIMKGAAVCFYGFIGFDCISTTGEEVRNAEKTIPISLIASIFITFLAYFGISSILTLLVPYYLEDDIAPLAFAFELIGLHWARTIVKIGSFFGLSASLIGAFFPISRIMYAMAQDGLLYRILGRVNVKYGTPVIATMSSGVIIGLTAALLDVDSLVKLNSLGTLLSYSVVALCIIVLRYADLDNNGDEISPILNNSKQKDELLMESQKLNGQTQRGNSNTNVINILISCIFTVLLASVPYWNLPNKLTIFVVLGCILTYFLMRIRHQKSYVSELAFRVPMVPFLPIISIFSNIYLMLQFDFRTWIYLWFWLMLGLIIYFTYGIFNSKERKTNKTR